MNDTRPIGILDSGLGGLSAAGELIRSLPQERFYYLGDTARGPYGNKSPDAIRSFSEECFRFLLTHDVKMILVAGNSISSLCLDHLRSLAKEIPVIGSVQPPAKAAVLRSVEKRVGVIGSTATIESGAYQEAINLADPSVEVFGKACPLFGPVAENALADSDIARFIAQRYLYQLVDMGIDTLIVGSSQFSPLIEAIQETAGSNTQVIDSCCWAIRELHDMLGALGLLSNESGSGLDNSTIAVTDLTSESQEIASIYMGTLTPPLRKVSLESLR